MKKYSVIITSSIISVLFILVTGWISFGNAMSVAFEFAFIFHVIPFGIGFTGGASIMIYLYYFLLWIGLSFLLSPFVRAFFRSQKKTKFLSFTSIPLILVAIIVVYIDYSKNKKREELIAKKYILDKENYSHLRTGDLLFQKVNNSLTSESSYNNIGIAFIEGGNYALLETSDQVQYVSIRQWIGNGNSGHYIAKRLRKSDSLLTSSSIQNLRKEARNNIAKKYDNSNDWSDDKMYNSELIWKMYERTFNIELGALDTITTGSINRLEIRPSTIFNSDKLMTVRKK